MTEEQLRSDEDRRQLRRMHDLTRSHDRGTRESQERLTRERAAADASLRAERNRSVHERQVTQRELDRASERCARAEQTLAELSQRPAPQAAAGAPGAEGELRRRALVQLSAVEAAAQALGEPGAPRQDLTSLLTAIVGLRRLFEEPGTDR